METNGRKKVCVRYISDDDVSNIFTALNADELLASKSITKRTKSDNALDHNLEQVEVPYSSLQSKPSSLFESGDVAGQHIFGFQTPKHRDAMANKASESANKIPGTPNKTPQTPREAKTSAQFTPLSRRGGDPHKILGQAMTSASSPSQIVLSHRKNCGTPKISKKLIYLTDETEKKQSLCPQTPYNLRKKFQKKLAATVSEELFYSDESEAQDFSVDESDWDSKSEESSANSSSDNEESNIAQKVVVSKRRVGFGTSLNKNLKLSFVPAAEEYFQSHASKKIRTSNHTLGKLRHNLPQEKLQKLLSETASSHRKHCEKLQNNVVGLFSKWHFMLREGFNILLYGVGSKHHILNIFQQEITEPCVVINGFFPSLTIQEIISSVSEDVLGLRGISVDLLETVDCIRNAFSQRSHVHLYLIVHNIDGVMLRNDKNQEVLAYLSSTPNIHLIASVDHISAPLMWDQNMLSMFNFSWWDTTTFQPYVNETAFESSLLVQQSGNLALSSLQNVFRSLTNNAKSIFLLMAEYQKEHKDDAHYSGMPFKKLYTLCRESLLVSSDLALRSQLTEFLDHRLVKSRRGHDGSELLTIPIDISILDQFVTQQSSL